MEDRGQTTEDGDGEWRIEILSDVAMERERGVGIWVEGEYKDSGWVSSREIDKWGQ